MTYNNAKLRSQIRWYNKQKEKGLCTLCNRKAVINETICEHHKAKRRIYMNVRNEKLRLKENDLCVL